jgi:hypothetical protein
MNVFLAQRQNLSDRLGRLHMHVPNIIGLAIWNADINVGV